MNNEEAIRVLNCTSLQTFCLCKVVIDGKMLSMKEALDMGAKALENQKTGHWIRITNGALKEKYICSECGRQIEDYGVENLLPIKYPYCHCGAKMEGE